MEAQRYIPVVSRSASLLAKEPVELAALVQSLLLCAEQWAHTAQFQSSIAREPLPFHVVFQGDTPAEVEVVMKRLKRSRRRCEPS
jgi:hypothetical protein